MRNKKGMIIPIVLAFQIGFGIIAAVCIWHIPAWTKAKHNHTEVDYQAQPMWPQK